MILHSRSFLVFCIALFALSCEQPVDTQLPYREQLVIQSHPTAGEHPFVLVSKTVPPLEQARRQDYLVSDASVSIIHEDISYPLHLDSSANQAQYTSTELRIKEGETYKLRVDWQQHTATATTHIPTSIPLADYSVEIEKNNDDMYSYYQLNCSHTYVIPDNTCITPFRILVKRNADNQRRERGFFPFDLLASWLDAQDDGTVTITPGGFFISDISQYQPFDTLVVESEIWDGAIRDYVLTRNNDTDESIFGLGGKNPVWNIDGGIGLFVGRNIVEDRVAIPN
jgi:hypothetical protein